MTIEYDRRMKTEKEYPTNLFISKEDEIVQDIRNKLSPILFHIDMAYDERIPMEIREKNRQQAKIAFDYITDRLKDFY